MDDFPKKSIPSFYLLPFTFYLGYLLVVNAVFDDGLCGVFLEGFDAAGVGIAAAGAYQLCHDRYADEREKNHHEDELGGGLPRRKAAGRQ